MQLLTVTLLLSMLTRLVVRGRFIRRGRHADHLCRARRQGTHPQVSPAPYQSVSAPLSVCVSPSLSPCQPHSQSVSAPLSVCVSPTLSLWPPQASHSRCWPHSVLVSVPECAGGLGPKRCSHGPRWCSSHEPHGDPVLISAPAVSPRPGRRLPSAADG